MTETVMGQGPPCFVCGEFQPCSCGEGPTDDALVNWNDIRERSRKWLAAQGDAKPTRQNLLLAHEAGHYLGVYLEHHRRAAEPSVEDVVKWLEGPNFHHDEEDEHGDTGAGRHSGGALHAAKAIRRKFGLKEQEPW